MYLFASPCSDRVVYITESQVLDLLLEAASLDDIYDKYYSGIPRDDFNKIVSSDPTYNSANPQKMGKYGKWLLSIYSQGNLKLEDLYKANEYLSLFKRYNGKLERRDINQYRSLNDLYDVVHPYIGNSNIAATKSEEVRNIKNGAEKVYEDDKWLVVIPHTQEASCYYGKGTQWCTAADRSENMFDYYNEYGPLYINIKKGTNTKYQFHFETDSFMDAHDRPIDWPIGKTIGLTPELVQFYVGKYGSDARALTSPFNPDKFKNVYGLQDIYIDGETKTKLIYYNYDTNEYKIICDLNANVRGYCFVTTCICDRYMMVADMNDADHANNLYDIQTKRLIFSDSDCIVRFNAVSFNSPYIQCESYTTGSYDLITRVFSLTDMKFTMEVPYDVRLTPLNRIVRARSRYGNNLFLSEKYAAGLEHEFTLIDAQTGKAVSPYTYNHISKKRVYINGGVVSVLCLTGNGRNDVVLFDGAIIDEDEFDANKESILQKYSNLITSLTRQ